MKRTGTIPGGTDEESWYGHNMYFLLNDIKSFGIVTGIRDHVSCAPHLYEEIERDEATFLHIPLYILYLLCLHSLKHSPKYISGIALLH